MNDDYKRGLVTGLAMHPLFVTTGADIVKFGTHNLLTDSGVSFNNSEYTDFAVSGEVCTCTIKECALGVNNWYRAIMGLKFKSGYMYRLTADRFRGYGRFGITNIPGMYPFANVGCNAYGTFGYDPNVPADGDNHVLQQNWLASQFYIGRNKSGYTTFETAAELWFCSDFLYNDKKDSHSFSIALYEEIKELN